MALYEYKAVIGGVTYGPSTLREVTRSGMLFDVCPIGSACIGTAEVSVWTEDAIPKGAAVKLYYAERGTENWRPKGSYLIARRRSVNGLLKLSCRDALCLADAVYLEKAPFGGAEVAWGTSATTDALVAADIADKIGVALDGRTRLMGYAVEYPNDRTMREVLSAIAVANCGNWIITNAGELYLVPYAPDIALLSDAQRTAILLFGDKTIWVPTVTSGCNNASYEVRRACDTFRDLGLWDAYNAVNLYYADESAVSSAGSGDGALLEADCYFATQNMADAILSALRDYRWHGFEAVKAKVSPEIDLGDIAVVDGLPCRVAKIKDSFCGLYRPTISCEGPEEVDEIPYADKVTRTLRRKVTVGSDYYGTKITRENGLVVEHVNATTGQVDARVVLNADELTFYQGDTEAIKFDPATGRYKFVGTVNIDGSLTFASGSTISWGSNNPASGRAYDSDLNALRNGTYGGGTFIDGKTIISPKISGNDIEALNAFLVGPGGAYGSMGPGSGNDGTGTTYGVKLTGADSLHYLIVTGSGVRMQAGSSEIWCSDSAAVLRAGGNTLRVNSSGLFFNGELIAQ